MCIRQSWQTRLVVVSSLMGNGNAFMSRLSYKRAIFCQRNSFLVNTITVFHCTGFDSCDRIPVVPVADLPLRALVLPNIFPWRARLSFAGNLSILVMNGFALCLPVPLCIFWGFSFVLLFFSQGVRVSVRTRLCEESPD